MFKIAKENFNALFQMIAESNALYVPVNNGNQVNFANWTESSQVNLDALKTVKSPKDAFFPQSETLYTCVKDGKKIKIQPEELQKQNYG